MVNNYIIVNNVFRHDLEQHIKGFTENHLLIYVYIQQFKTYSGEINFCMGWLFDDLGINYNQQQQLYQCFVDLISWKLVVVLNNINEVKKNTRIRCKLPAYQSRFTQISVDDVRKIFNHTVDIRTKKTMLFLYCDIASWIDEKQYCYPSFVYLKADLGTTSDNRINDALAELKAIQVIDYDRVGYIIDNNNISRGNNIYTLCCIKEYQTILQQAIQNRSEQLLEENIKIIKG